MITGKQLVEKLYSEGWELEQREYGLLSKMKGFISKRNLEKYYRYKGELNRLKNEKSKIQGELSNLDERAPKNMKLERAIQREAINENSFVTRYAENSNVDIKDKKIKEVLKNSINNSDRVSERDKRKLSKLIDNRDHAIYYNRNQGGPASLAPTAGIIAGIRSGKKAAEKEAAGENYRFKRKNIESNYDNEFSELETKYNQAKKLNTTLGYDPESAQKILKDLKKDNIKTAVGSNLTTEYNYKNDTININNIHRKNPYTILHEVGHRVSDNREQLRGGKYYGNYRSLDKKVNTSHNLHNSIMNNVGNLSTLMNEANASYHAAALAKKYNLPREMQKAGNKSLDYSFRTYESNAANKMMTDDTVRLLGKYKNK